MLYALSFSLEWSNGYPELDEWLALLQESVDEAWRDPSNPENALLVLLFNKGKFVLPDPPTLSPHTRLNAFQAYLLGASIMSAGIKEELEAKRAHGAKAGPVGPATPKDKATPVADAGPDQVAALDQVVNLDGTGSYDPDGFGLVFQWMLATPADSEARLRNAGSATPSFATDVVGNYVATLVVSNGVASSVPDDVTVSTGGAPIANAGSDQRVLPASLVNLDGSASWDPEGDNLTYLWSLTSAPLDSEAELSDPAVINPSFLAEVEGTYIIELVVNDGDLDSAPDTVKIVANTKPVAKAGDDQTVAPGDTAQLDGSRSWDLNDDSIEYQWRFAATPVHSRTVLNHPRTAFPLFVPDIVGEYDIQLVVNDGWEDSEPDVVRITAGGPPIAHAGQGRTVDVGDTVQLDGRNSWDPDGQTLTYLWVLVSAPAGSTAFLSNPNVVAPTFVADVEGDYEVELTVNDGEYDSEPDSIIITAGGPRDYFTGYWRNFFERKESVIQRSFADAYLDEFETLGRASLLAASGSLEGALLGASIAGLAPDFLGEAMINQHITLYIPEPPRNVRAEVIYESDGTQRVAVDFERSPNDPAEAGGNVNYTYSLYRFRGTDERRDFLGMKLFLPDAELTFSDPDPLNGTYFYAISTTRFTGRVQYTESWWPAAFQGALNIFAKGGRRLTSDYSAPATVYVGPGDVAVTFDGLEVDPDYSVDGIVYYSDAGNGVLYGIGDWGRGERFQFAEAGFKPSFRAGREIIQYGLGVDSLGNLYCDNAASDATFGGRLFRFKQPNGGRECCGTINYFSMVLMFAHPCECGSMVIRPAPSAGAKETLIVVNNLNQEILEVPVKETYDANRRVGQPFGHLPAGGWGTVLDMEYDTHDYLHVLDGWRVVKVKDGVAEVAAYFAQ